MNETYHLDENLVEPASQERVIDNSLLNIIKPFINSLDKDDRALSTIEKILEMHLREKIANTTFDAVTSSLEIYIGADAMTGFLSLIDGAIEDPGFIEKLETDLPNNLWPDIRAVVAIFGKKLADASSSSEQESPNSWKTINRQVYFDRVTEQWRIAYDIEKFNGELACFEEEPSSFLAMAESILDTLSYIPGDKVEDLFDPVRLDDFRNACSRFLTKIANNVE